MCSFIKKSLEERKHIYNSMIKDHPDRIPLVLQRGNNETPIIKRSRYLVPKEMLMVTFQSMARTRYLDPTDYHKAIFFMYKEVFIPSTSSFGELYTKYQSKHDGMLYITYIGENSFG